jgi:serralysin
VLEGSTAANTIRGGSGNDIILGKGGQDALFGDAGNDSFVFEGLQSYASLDGGEGFDTILAGDDDTKLAWAAVTGVEAIDGDGYANVTINGSAAADTIVLTDVLVTGIAAINANAGNDTVIGSAGADVINGLGGLDVLNGGGGNDVVTGGLGIDTMTGGSGADNFVFGRIDSGRTAALGDIITDFLSADGDKIDLSQIDADTSNGAGNDAFSFIGDGAFNAVAGELRFEVVANGIIVQGDWNGDGRADFTINVNNVTTIAGADFVL